ncbi:MAG TPA: TlpA disulfide reductase family protein [Xanthobacteraceae bacterium]|nr:TlpA disulfide reductase family protein [Xanthobacteraceae bacterium]
MAKVRASVSEPATRQRAADMSASVGNLRFGLAIWLCATTFVATLRIASAQEPPKSFVFLDTPTPATAISFNDANGRTRSVADFKGKVVLLNVWATWCVPCRTEMPALDRLQATLGGSDFEVVPVSIDRGGLETIRKFYSDIGIGNLAMYVDSSGQVLRQVSAFGLPTTLLIDGAGQEIGRVIGPAEWDKPEIIAFVKCFVSRNEAAAFQNGSKSNAIPPCDGRDLGLPASGASINARP